MTVERRALSGSLMTGLTVLVRFGEAIVMVPLFLQHWGKEKYGLWLALHGAFALVITLDTGHQAYVGNEFAKLYPVDKAALRKVLASAVWIALLIGVVEIIVGVVLWQSGLLSTVLGTSPENAHSHRLGLALVALLLTWMLVGSVGGVLARVLLPAGHFTRFAAWGVASQVMLLAIWGVGVALEVSILTLVVCQVIGQVVYGMALFLDLKNVCHEVYPFWAPADLRLGLRNLSRSIVLTGTSILTQLQQNGLNLLVSGIFGVALLPVLTTARTLANVFVQGTNIVAAPLSPDIVRYHVKGEHEKLVGAWSGIWFVGGALINVGLVVSLVVVKPFYAFWTRGAMALDLRLYLPLVAAVAVKAFGVPLLTYITGLNHLRGLTILAASQAAVTLGGAWILSSTLGLAGATFSILAAELVGCVILVLVTRSALRETDSEMPWNQLTIAGIPPAISCVAFALAGFEVLPEIILVALTLPCLSTALFMHWRKLPSAVTDRMLELVLRRKAGG